MAPSILRPPKRTGPAGEYDEALRRRNLKAAEWLGLDLNKIWDFGYGLGSAPCVWKSEERTGRKPGPLRRGDLSESPAWDGERLTISYSLTLHREDSNALASHLGPLPEPPRFVSLWHARPEDLTPGTKLYNAEGDVVGEVGESVRGTDRGVAFGVFG